MRRKVLLGIALIVSLVGMFSLILLAEFSELERVNIIGLESRVGQRVVVSGEVVRATQKSENNFFEVWDGTGEITVVAFGEMSKLKKGSEIEVQGKVAIYKGELEVIADKIKTK